MQNVRWISYHVSADTAERFQRALDVQSANVEANALTDSEYIGAYQVSHAVTAQDENESGVLFSAVVTLGIVRKGALLRA